MFHTVLAFASVSFAFVLSACSSQASPKAPDEADPYPNTNQATPPPAQEPPGAKVEPATTHGPSSMPTDAAPAPTPPPDAQTALSDEQILQVTHTANAGEIAQAKLAKSKTKDPRVKKLAEMMLKDHGDADGKGTALAKKDNLTPSVSSTSTSLEADAGSATDALQGKSGPDFDKAYVDTQVKEHQAVLALLDDKLIPAAKSPDVKSYLADVRPKIAMHLQHAQDLQKEMTK